MKTVKSASTTYINNQEIDKEIEVLHDVHVCVNGIDYIVQIMAEDPINALNIVNKMSKEDCFLYRKKNSLNT